LRLDADFLPFPVLVDTERRFDDDHSHESECAGLSACSTTARWPTGVDDS
jgi:hypothetical protein